MKAIFALFVILSISYTVDAADQFADPFIQDQIRIVKALKARGYSLLRNRKITHHLTDVPLAPDTRQYDVALTRDSDRQLFECVVYVSLQEENDRAPGKYTVSADFCKESVGSIFDGDLVD